MVDALRTAQPGPAIESRPIRTALEDSVPQDGSAGRITVRHFAGGHMFYAWADSRRAFATAIADFVADATAR
jgi:hypothetical protein